MVAARRCQAQRASRRIFGMPCGRLRRRRYARSPAATVANGMRIAHELRRLDQWGYTRHCSVSTRTNCPRIAASASDTLTTCVRAQPPLRGVPVTCSARVQDKGKGMFADRAFAEGEVVFVETKLLGMQSAASRARVLACAHCMRHLGTLEQQLWRVAKGADAPPGAFERPPATMPFKVACALRCLPVLCTFDCSTCVRDLCRFVMRVCLACVCARAAKQGSWSGVRASGVQGRLRCVVLLNQVSGGGAHAVPPAPLPRR